MKAEMSQMLFYSYGGSGVTRPLPWDGDVKKFHRPQQSGHTPRSELKAQVRSDTSKKRQAGEAKI